MEKTEKNELVRKLIFNPQGDREASKRKIIKGNPTNIFELNEIKYSWAFDLYKLMGFTNFWIPEEIQMLEDRKQYETVLSDYEKRAYELVLSFLIALDSFQVDMLKEFGRMITAPEVEMAITAQEFQESVHAYSYQFILESVVDPVKADEIYNYWREDERLLERNKVIAELYNEFIRKPNEENFIKATIGNYILESLYFYSGFAFFYTLGRQGKMRNTVQQIKYINRDELCFIEGTEVLTKRGFVDFRELREDDLVAQYDIETGEISWTKPYAYVERDYEGSMYRLKHPKSNWEVVATEGHEFIVRNLKTGKERKEPIEKVKLHPYSAIPVAGRYTGEVEEYDLWELVSGKGITLKTRSAVKNKLTPIEKLLIVLQADGTIDSKRNGKFTGFQQLKFFFSKYRKINEFEKILNECAPYGIKWKKYERQDGIAYTVYYPNDLPIKPTKFFDEWVRLDEITEEWIREFVEELVKWDGHIPKDRNKKKVYYYSTKEKRNKDFVQALCALGGMRTVVSRERNPKAKNPVYRIWIYLEDDYINTQTMVKEEFYYKGKVYCVSVPKGNIVVRYKDSVCIAGNCHVTLFRNIINTLRKENPELFTPEIEKWIVEYFKYAVNEEIKWGQYVTQNQILGINDVLIERYIKYLGNLRITQIGFDPIYPEVTENPLKWIDEFRKINNTKTDFFQAKPQTYSKANELKW
ncbi:ribonucleotide-diphosphate reductase subunit beta [Aquifex aeolicus]|uniref:Ribonucleoside-diphosphate reductase subunit beta n=1 Tax=Aquifex aeolicus (strain VF5) TaxID=224324 RepID=RIR2_AQUAE|nr:ribonucleotide-diphosphate reductase subunit beta [Aquifex aeolicus]O67475.1 RecName: Full=Ribonucleoside-diphosphate reductase subunit beta; AltName: Full=Ribonucleotide reductase small subunit; Contains: RecName: Full=Aae NrdB intein; AltName: Full=Aae RIR2 intein [Aquifex aeolicus VF5]AAC07431.1 ribonucleotide reductase beta chain [Aquifex aeolicus VF5]